MIYSFFFTLSFIHPIPERTLLTAFTMGTRGRIAIEYNGRILCCIWVNCDAYPSFVGKVILAKLHGWYVRNRGKSTASVQLLATSMIDVLHGATIELVIAPSMSTLLKVSKNTVWCEHLYVVHINHNATTEVTYVNTSGSDEFEVKCDRRQFKHIIETNGIWDNLPKDLQRITHRQEPPILIERYTRRRRHGNYIEME